MRLLPAHLNDAKEMAKRLKTAFDDFGLTLYPRDPDHPLISLQQTQNLMARALNYPGGWKELSAELNPPHLPIYLDTLPSEKRQELFYDVVARLAQDLGYDYNHGSVYNALQVSGVGCSPSARHRLDNNVSPWGLITEEEADPAIPGITRIETASHGGYRLTAERQAQMPEHLKMPDGFYEEDCDWALVALAFPAEYPDLLADALGATHILASNSIPRKRESEAQSPVGEDILTAVLFGENQNSHTRKRSPNRVMTAEEQGVVAYLAECVRLNKCPVKQPDDPFPTLQQWVNILSTAPTVDGHWPMLAGPWEAHWNGFDLSNARQERYNAAMWAALDNHPSRKR